MKTTIRQLASALHLSIGTVSLAVRDHPSVAIATRRRVQELANALGYRRNPFLSTMMSHVRSAEPAAYEENLAWLSFWPTRDHFVNPRASGFAEYHRDLWLGASQRARQLGYKLDSFWGAEPGMTGKRLSEIIEARGIRGILIPPLPSSCGHLSMSWNIFSSVALSHTLARPQLNRVVPDHHANMQLILRRLRHYGYRRIGLLIPNRFDERSENRFRSAFSFYQQTLPVGDRVPTLTTSNEDFETNAGEWLQKFQPDAVITTGGYRGLRNLEKTVRSGGMAIGIALMGYAETDFGYAAINENPLTIGATGVDQLLGQLSRNERGVPEVHYTVMVRGSWVDGETASSPARRRKD